MTGRTTAEKEIPDRRQSARNADVYFLPLKMGAIAPLLTLALILRLRLYEDNFFEPPFFRNVAFRRSSLQKCLCFDENVKKGLKGLQYLC